MISWDDERWKGEVETKTSLKVYKRWKLKIKEDDIYDNTPQSRILFQAMTDTLPLNARKRFTKERIHCDLCEAENEDINRFLLECPTLSEVRVKRHELQKPYLENKELRRSHYEISI